MNLKSIKPGKWYQTTLGVGKCVSSGGTFPPGCRIEIIAPFPRGVVNLTPRDVKHEVDPLPSTP